MESTHIQELDVRDVELLVPHNGRRSPRVELHVDVSIDGDTNFYAGCTENVSESGVFVATYLLRPVGTEIEVSFTLPDSEALLELTGVVRWIRDPHNLEGDVTPGMGIEFLALSDGDATRIQDFIRMQAPIFYPD